MYRQDKRHWSFQSIQLLVVASLPFSSLAANCNRALKKDAHHYHQALEVIEYITGKALASSSFRRPRYRNNRRSEQTSQTRYHASIVNDTIGENRSISFELNSQKGKNASKRIFEKNRWSYQ